MDVTIQTTGDEFSRAGMAYFFQRYGFAPGDPKENLHLTILPGSGKAQPDCRITGWVRWKGYRLPVLLPPPPVEDLGPVLLSYDDGSSEYPCAVETSSGIIISLDVPGHLGRFLSGHLEKTWTVMKEERRDTISVPFTDYYCDFLLTCIRNIFNKHTIPLVCKAALPEGRSFAVCLTHDVDELRKSYQWLTRPWKYAKEGNVRGLLHQARSFRKRLRGDEPYWTFDHLLDLEDELGARSSFYFLNETSAVRISDKKTWRHLGRRYDWNAPRVRAVMKEMEDAGWEVGLHSSFDSYKDPGKIISEKRALEHALGTTGGIVGVRQHNLNLAIPDTWIAQENAGLLYDTTLGYNDCMGFRWGTCLPFHPYLPAQNRSMNLLEIPLIIEDIPFFRDPCRREAAVNLIRQISDQNGILTLLWHHSAFNAHEYPGWEAAYRQIIEYCTRRNAWVTSGKQIFQWWLQREASAFTWRYHGRTVSIHPVPDSHLPRFLTVYCPDGLAIRSVRNGGILRTCQNIVTIRTEDRVSGDIVEIEFDMNTVS